MYQICASRFVDTNMTKDLPGANEPAALLEEFKSMAETLHPTIKQLFDLVGPHSKIIPITIADWDTVAWDGQGRITLAGDAAHAMTMFRGEGANHGITDAVELVQELDSCLDEIKSNGTLNPAALKEAMRRYETKVHSRASVAVLQSRQACLDSHFCDGLSVNSPLLISRDEVAHYW